MELKYLAMGIIYVLNGFFVFLINFTIFSIHIREPLLRSNFFKVVFYQLFLETLIDVLLIILSISIMITSKIKEWNHILFMILNFCINTDILYNIVILIYLTFRKVEEDKKIDDDEREENINARASISFARHSFKCIHFFSIMLGIAHTVIFGFIKEDTNNVEIDYIMHWFYFFYPVKADVAHIFIFIPYLIYLIVSIPYLCISLKRLAITNNIHLKHYCINCIIGALLGLIMPIAKVSTSDIKDIGIPLFFFSSAFFILYIDAMCFFRYNCYYIEHILSNNGNEFFKKIKFFINIMFYRVEVPKPNFIDYNNPFIYHSLAYESDLLGNNNNQEENLSYSSQN